MKRILFSFNETEEEDIPNGYCVIITTEEKWKKKQCIDDTMSAPGDDAIQKLEDLGLFELMGGCYEAAGWENKDDLKEELEKAGFLTDAGFDKWASQLDMNE